MTREQNRSHFNQIDHVNGSVEVGIGRGEEAACSGESSGVFVSEFSCSLFVASCFWTQSGTFDDLEGEVSDEWAVDKLLG